MTKQELLNQLQATGQAKSPFRKSPLWDEAFEMYKAQTGDFKVSLKCGQCFLKVLEWLKK